MAGIPQKMLDSHLMEVGERIFPIVCPGCQAQAGNPHNARTVADQLLVDLRCDVCRHEWTIAAPSPLIFRRKPDRRSEPVT
jgi:hypothetical protein